MDRRQLRLALAIGVAGTLIGCKTPQGGLLGWGRGSQASAVSAAPDISKQKYDGMSQEFAGAAPGASNTAPTTGMGGAKPAAPQQNMFSSAWTKTSAAVGSALTIKPRVEAPEDATSLNSTPKKFTPELYIAHARVLENQGKLDEAAQNYKQALKVGPGNVTTLVSLARLQDRQAKTTDAIETYRKALKADPQNALVYNDLGLCYARQKDTAQSLTNLNKAVELQPSNAKYRNNLAAVLIEAGRTDDAYAQLAAVNTPAVAHYNLGYLLHQRGQSEAAAIQMQQALAADPNMAPAAAMLAQIAGPAMELAQRPLSVPPSTPHTPLGPLPAHGGLPNTATDGSSLRRISHEEPVEDDAEVKAEMARSEPVVQTVSDEEVNDLIGSLSEPKLLPATE